MRVLVVEDDIKVGETLRDGLTEERYEVVLERTGEGACARSASEAFDLILLDLGLPGCSGLDVLATIRRRRVQAPVIVLTARDTVADRVTALDRGADDFMVKPFAFSELLARMRAMSRRGASLDSARSHVGPLMLDRLTREVTRSGAPVPLTAREFELLDYLMRADGAPVSRDALARDVWQEAERSPSLDNVIDVHILRLRRKIDLNPSHRLLQTVRGVGFVLRDGDA